MMRREFESTASSHSVHQRESAFHDHWARDESLSLAEVMASFEGPAAPENQFILERMGPLAGQRVLDVGAGRGEAAIYFALQGAEVTALDVSAEMCALCRHTARQMDLELQTLCGPLEGLDRVEAFDIVYGANVLHHVVDHPTAIAAVARALRPGGRAFFWDPLAYNPLLNIYRAIATQVRSCDERPVTFALFDLFAEHFIEVEHREFWLASMAIFLKYYLWDRVHPNDDRYWKRILREDPRSLRWWFTPLQRLDQHLLALPLLNRLAWNTVIIGQKAP